MIKILGIFLVVMMSMKYGIVNASNTIDISEQHILVYHHANLKSYKAPASYFSGRAIVTRVFDKNEMAKFSGGAVTFEPGARTYWHIHPAGQLLIVQSGTALAQEWGRKTIVLHAGDMLWCPPNVKHWHGADMNGEMVQIALTGDKEGKAVTWLEEVSDATYRQAVLDEENNQAL
ncbi:quercetin dioxygenase-like cupin family protein [Pectinatus haikarae]|uniref:Quercetin dioxygenase-like cupin family protein n=1 Tax=Pectinatus haikarae TaxID=349096 RepID=A0ABT9Y9J5_9FIRM|nr:quercetin dioxygenase-like cupin family protein [Pectinatus haikarae]